MANASGNRGLVVSVSLGLLLFSLGILLLPYFPNEIPAASATAIIQSMIEVNGVIFGFSAIAISILTLNPMRKVEMRSIFAFMFTMVAIFFGAVFFNVLDLANMGDSISRALVLRDVLIPVFFGFAMLYLTAEIYRESQ